MNRNCPCCDKPLTKGFIQCRDGLYWTPKKQLIPALSALGKGARRLHNDDNLGPNRVHALYCPSCGMALIPRENHPLLK